MTYDDTEMIPREELRTLQNDRIAETVRHVYENVEFYADRIEAADLTPPNIKTVENIETIPFGKGMAGRAAERREPVEVSNLQTDDSGVAKPRARDTGMEGSIAVPIIGSDGKVKGVVGVAKPEAYEFGDDERDALLTAGKRVADRL